MFIDTDNSHHCWQVSLFFSYFSQLRKYLLLNIWLRNVEKSKGLEYHLKWTFWRKVTWSIKQFPRKGFSGKKCPVTFHESQNILKMEGWNKRLWSVWWVIVMWLLKCAIVGGSAESHVTHQQPQLTDPDKDSARLVLTMASSTDICAYQGRTGKALRLGWECSSPPVLALPLGTRRKGHKAALTESSGQHLTIQGWIQYINIFVLKIHTWVEGVVGGTLQRWESLWQIRVSLHMYRQASKN